MSHDNTMEIHYPNCPVPLLIDIDDYDILKKFIYFPARMSNGYYMQHTTGGSDSIVKRKTYSLAREIMGAIGGAVDHINGNSMDNRKSNLRICSRHQNSFNRRKLIAKSSKYKGIHWRSDRLNWRAQIRLNGKLITIGHYKDEIKAAKAYDEKAKQLFGEFAGLNFPEVMKGAV